MSERKVVSWITIKGIHIPIFEKESEQDAVNKSIAKKNEEIKQRQIENNRKQVEQIKQSQLPKRIYYDDIPAEVANETTDVIHLRTRKRYKFQNGTAITEVNAFAGKGCSRPFRDAEKYAKRYPKSGKAENWQHCAGKAQITDGMKSFMREVHWVQGEDRKMREAFIKEYPNKLKDEKGKKR